MNRLRGMRAYLAGAMDRVADGGVGWRRAIGGWLHFRGVEVYDPCDKPIDIGIEDFENRNQRHQWKATGNYDAIASDMRTIRGVDLRMVDVVDFLVINLDLDVHACGTYEELFLANREKKPCIIRCEQGKSKIPDWLFGVLPHEMMFSTWAEVHQYLVYVDSSPKVNSHKRWYFFDHLKARQQMANSLITQYAEIVSCHGPDSREALDFKHQHHDCRPFFERSKIIDSNWRTLKEHGQYDPS